MVKYFSDKEGFGDMWNEGCGLMDGTITVEDMSSISEIKRQEKQDNREAKEETEKK